MLGFLRNLSFFMCIGKLLRDSKQGRGMIRFTFFKNDSPYYLEIG